MLLNKKIPITYILGKIKVEIIYVCIIGLVTYYLTHKYEEAIPDMPIPIPAFVGTAISVILSFKLSQSYDRWWEARKIWGNIVNESRTLVLQLQSFFGPGNEEDIRIIAYRHMAWCYSLGQSLRGQDAMKDLPKYLSPEDIEEVAAHHNKPLAILQLNTHHIASVRKEEQLDVFYHVQLNQTLVNLTNAMGMAERIKSTVFPVTYRYFLHWIIYLFAILLSISLKDVESYYELPLLVVISSAFFLLEKSATHLQDPFNNRPTDTAMTTIATNIEINLKQLLKEKSVPAPVPPKEFYAM